MHPLLFELKQLIFPRACLGCNKQLYSHHHFLCLNCTSVLPLIGGYKIENQTEKIFYGRFPFGFAYSHLYFQKGNSIQTLMHHFKYHGLQEIGIWLGNQIGEEIKTISAIVDDTILIPVPLNDKKQYQRGFNQSQILAEGIAETSGIPIADKSLLRTVNTSTQTKKNRLERLQNMANVFEVGDAKALEGKHIILIDDIITTGSTLEACALELLKIPKTKLSIVTAALSIQ
jgi:ComF family protein